MANDLGEPVGDGVVGLADILCAMDGFSTPSACTSMDQKPCLQVDGTNDVDDLLVVLDAFGGETYPVSCAAAYPPCYAPAAPPPLPALKHNPYYFTGQRLDHDLKNASGETVLALYHYRARAYDPIHGRFLQRDPAEYGDSSDLYEYVTSQPLSSVDPSGEELLSTFLDLGFLLYDIYVGAEVATIQMDILALVIPGPNVVKVKKVAGILIETVEDIVVRSAELKTIKSFSREVAEQAFKEASQQIEQQLASGAIELGSEVLGEGGAKAYASRMGRQRISIGLQYLGSQSEYVGPRHFTHGPKSMNELMALTSVDGRGSDPVSKWAGWVGDSHIRGWIDEALGEKLSHNSHPNLRELNFRWDTANSAVAKRTGNFGHKVGASEGKCTTWIRIKTENNGTVHAFPWPPEKPYPGVMD